MQPRDSKRQQLDLCDNEEKKNLDNFEGESEGEVIKYYPFPFIIPLQKKSSRLTNISKGSRSLNYFIYIPKIG